MARPSDEDSGVRSLQELSPRFTDPGTSRGRQGEAQGPFWTSEVPVAAQPYAQPPPVWTPPAPWSSQPTGQWQTAGSPWSPPLQAIEPPHYTPPPIGLGMRKPRRWGLRFFMFAGMVGLGCFLARDYLPPFPRSLGEASAAIDSIGASLHRVSGGLVGKQATPPTEKAAVAAAPRGPQIVQLPSAISAVPAPAPPTPTRTALPVATTPPAVDSPAPAGTATRARPVTARPTRVASPAPVRPAKAAKDPFEEDEPLVKPERLRTTNILAAREVGLEKAPPPPVAARPEPVERPAPAPRPAAGSLEDLMGTAVKPAPRAKSELDRKLAGFDDTREPAPAKKKAEVSEPPPAPALTRNDIQAAMRGIQPKIGDCYKQFGKGGPADVKVTVDASGSVTSVTLTGPFAGTPSGACVERAVRGADFPASAGLRFDYRLTLR